MAKLVEDVPAGGLGENWRVGRALPWHRRRRRGMEASVGRRRIYKSQKSLAVYVHVVQAEIGVQTGGGGGCWGGWRMHWRHRSVTVGRRERTYARSMFMGLVTRASRGCRVKESQRWVWRSFAWARQKNAWATNGPRVGPQCFYRCFGPPANKREFTGHQCQIPVFSATSGISLRDRLC